MSQVSVLRFDHLCYGQWFSMVNLSPRLPLKQHVSDVMETTESLRDKTDEQKSDIMQKSGRPNRLVTEKPDFEIIDEDYLL